MKLITKTSLSLAVLAVIFAGGCSLNRPSEPVSLAPENTNATSTEDVVSTTSTRYILTSGYEFDKQKKLSHEWLSVYQTNGDFVKTINNRREGVVFGQRIYRQINSRLSTASASSTDVSVIEAFSPLTEITTILEFTKTNNTNPYNSINPIIAFTVSSDEKNIAWQNTSGEIFISKMDGSDLNLIATTDKRSTSVLSFSEKGDELFFYGNDGQYSWSLQKQSVERIDDRLYGEGDAWRLLSSSGRFLAKVKKISGFEPEEIITITDTIEYKTVEVSFSTDELVPPSDTFPASYSPSIIGFSSDEKKLLFGFGSAWYQWAGTYRVDVDGNNLETLFKDAEPLVYLSDSTVLVSRISKGLQITSMDGAVLKTFPIEEVFTGLLTVRG